MGRHLQPLVRFQRLQEVGWQVGWFRPVPQEVAADSAGFTLKCGGSLLSRADWPQLLQAVLSGSEAPVRLVVGGGLLVEALRTLDAACPQPPDRMHRLAIEAMAVTARMVAEELGLPLSGEQAATVPQHCVINPLPWLASGRFAGLPASWAVTSDSLAALIATANSEPLLLLKSVPPPAAGGSVSLADLADAGWVDPILSQAAASVSGLGWAVPPQPATALSS